MSKLPVITLPPLLLAGIVFAMAGSGLFGVDKAALAVLRVPQRFAGIQSAIDAAKSGDTVLVAAGVYRERLKMKPGVTVKSEGDDAKGKVGLKRAEDTVLASADGEGAGVEMAEGATLDGFTVTGVGKYDESLWQHHCDTHGNE